MVEKIKTINGEIAEDDILLTREEVTLGCLGLLGLGAIIASISCNRVSSVNSPNIETKIENVQIFTENIRDGSEPEKFYWVNNQRVYLEIDGKPVEEYFRK
ncbi:MAG: hypothetical protein Q8R00_00770 [Candidatus Nanoarchaeia archaeon]|nr:hypothetical protein [Candidatus Nanoarchaeia archaeon]